MLNGNTKIFCHTIKERSMLGRTLYRSYLSGRLPYTIARNYHPNVIDHYENPRNMGSFDKNERGIIGTGIVGAPACGDVMKLQIKVDPQTNKIIETRFKTFGCGSAIASSSLSTEWIKGMTLGEATRIRNSAIAKHLHLTPVKLHCSMLAEDAIVSAVNDVKKKIK